MASRSTPEAKTERLLNLVIALLHTQRPLTKERIRSAVPQYAEAPSAEAFDRMFERDKDELRDLGIPLRAEHLDSFFEDETGYRIDRREYELPDLHFGADELAVLGLASRAWQQASLARPAAAALRKLEALGIEHDTGSLVGLEPRIRTAEPAFEAVKDAVMNRQEIRFHYRTSGGEAAVRRLQPWVVTNTRGRWYVTGFDVDRRAPRLFRLSRIDGAVATAGRPGAYTVPTDHDAQTMIAQVERTPDWEPAVLRVCLGRGHSLVRRARTVGKVDDEWNLIDLAYDDVDILADEVASYGADVRVEQPETLKDAVIRRLRGARDVHRGSPPGATESKNEQDNIAHNTEHHDTESGGYPMSESPASSHHAAAYHPGDPTSGDPSGSPRGGIAGEPATARLSRLLTMVPWLMNRQGIDIEQTACTMGVSRRQIEADLSLLFVCGTPGHMPDDLIEAEWEEGHVYVRNADEISRPLRFTRDEALALSVGLRTLLDVPGLTERDAVDRALAKLVEATGESSDPSDRVRVSLERDGDEVLRALREALTEQRRVRLRYLAASRDEMTERDVEPMRLLNTEGHWYLEGWCHRAGDTRLFRLDRIDDVAVLDETAHVPENAQSADLSQGFFASSSDESSARLRLAPQAHWVADYYPSHDAERHGTHLDVTFYVGGGRWLKRLLLRLGAGATVLSPRAMAQDVADEAERALAQYGTR